MEAFGAFPFAGRTGKIGYSKVEDFWD